MSTARRACAIIFGLVLAQAACSIPAFTCEGDAQCVAEASGGRCEADHRCSYPDDDCPSGRRYGEYAGDLSRACVEGSGTSESGSSTEALTTSTTAASGTTTTSGGSASTSSTTTTESTSGESSTTGNIPLAPLGHWPLDDDGPVAMDISGNDHHGAREGGTWVEGQIGGAIRFSVEDHGIDVGTDSAFDLDGASGVTLMGWARFDDVVISNVPIIAKFGAYNLLFYATSDNDVITGGTPLMYIYPEGGTSDGDTDGPLDQNGAARCYGTNRLLVGATKPSEDLTIWHHYASTYDVASRMMYFYVDGVEEGVTDASVEMQDGTIQHSDSGLQLGRWQSSGPTLRGSIDDVRIYDFALSAEDIAVIFAQGR